MQFGTSRFDCLLGMLLRSEERVDDRNVRREKLVDSQGDQRPCKVFLCKKVIIFIERLPRTKRRFPTLKVTPGKGPLEI